MFEDRKCQRCGKKVPDNVEHWAEVDFRYISCSTAVWAGDDTYHYSYLYCNDCKETIHKALRGDLPVCDVTITEE